MEMKDGGNPASFRKSVKTSWESDGALFTIEQGANYPGWIYVFCKIIGLIMFPVGLLLLIGSLADDKATILSTQVLVCYLIMLTGMGAIHVGFFSPEKNYREKIIFDNTAEMVLFRMNNLGDVPYEIPYSGISRIQTLLEKGGPDYPDLYLIYLIQKDGSEFWITNFYSQGGGFLELAGAIAAHTGFAVIDSSGLGAEKRAAKSYSGTGKTSDYPAPGFIDRKATSEGDVISIKKPHASIFSTITGMLAFLCFLSAPMYIINSMTNSPPIARGITYFFTAFWYIMMMILFLYYSKDCSIIVNDLGIKITARSKPFIFIKSTVFIPASHILNVRTNRIAGSGGVCSLTLSIGISPDFKSLKSGSSFLMNRGVRGWKYFISKFGKGEKAISLWEISAYSKAGKSPTVFDLIYIEKFIQDRLRLTEKEK
jgi:hypothetical protein